MYCKINPSRQPLDSTAASLGPPQGPPLGAPHTQAKRQSSLPTPAISSRGLEHMFGGSRRSTRSDCYLSEHVPFAEPIFIIRKLAPFSRIISWCGRERLPSHTISLYTDPGPNLSGCQGCTLSLINQTQMRNFEIKNHKSY